MIGLIYLGIMIHHKVLIFISLRNFAGYVMELVVVDFSLTCDLILYIKSQIDHSWWRLKAYIGITVGLKHANCIGMTHCFIMVVSSGLDDAVCVSRTSPWLRSHILLKDVKCS